MYEFLTFKMRQVVVSSDAVALKRVMTGSSKSDNYSAKCGIYTMWQPPLSQVKNYLIWAGYLWLVEKAEGHLWFVEITAVSIGWSDFGKMDQSEELTFTQKILFCMPLSRLLHQIIWQDKNMLACSGLSASILKNWLLLFFYSKNVSEYWVESCRAI